MGMGIGAAMTGLRPIIEGMNMGFLLLAYNQISNNAGMLHYTSGGQFKVSVGTLTGRQTARQLPLPTGGRPHNWSSQAGMCAACLSGLSFVRVNCSPQYPARGAKLPACCRSLPPVAAAGPLAAVGCLQYFSQVLRPEYCSVMPFGCVLPGG